MSTWPAAAFLVRGPDDEGWLRSWFHGPRTFFEAWPEFLRSGGQVSVGATFRRGRGPRAAARIQDWRFLHPDVPLFVVSNEPTRFVPPAPAFGRAEFVRRSDLPEAIRLIGTVNAPVSILGDEVGEVSSGGAEFVFTVVQCTCTPPPIRTVGSLADRLDLSRPTLYRRWQARGLAAVWPSPKSLLDQALLALAYGHRSEGRTWEGTARQLGVSIRTLRRTAHRVTRSTLRDLSVADLCRIRRALLRDTRHALRATDTQ